MQNKRKKGIALLLAVVIAGLLITIALAMIHIAKKDVTLSVSGRESQFAFYAADIGIECALYWDIQQGVFATSTDATGFSGSALCGTEDIFGNDTVTTVENVTTTTFTLNYTDGRCTEIAVQKEVNSGTITTVVESRGHNSCAITDPRRVERAIRAIY